MHDLMKGSFVPNNVQTLCDQLSRKLHRGIAKLEDGEMDLMILVKSIMFPAIVAELFGDDMIPEGKVWLLYYLAMH